MGQEINADSRFRQVRVTSPAGASNLRDALSAEALRELASARIKPSALEEFSLQAGRPARNPVDVLVADLAGYSGRLQQETLELETAREIRPSAEVRIANESARRKDLDVGEQFD